MKPDVSKGAKGQECSLLLVPMHSARGGASDCTVQELSEEPCCSSQQPSAGALQSSCEMSRPRNVKPLKVQLADLIRRSGVAMGIEPSTSSLGSCRSTTELRHEVRNAPWGLSSARFVISPMDQSDTIN